MGIGAVPFSRGLMRMQSNWQTVIGDCLNLIFLVDILLPQVPRGGLAFGVQARALRPDEV